MNFERRENTSSHSVNKLNHSMYSVEREILYAASILIKLLIGYRRGKLGLVVARECSGGVSEWTLV